MDKQLGSILTAVASSPQSLRINMLLIIFSFLSFNMMIMDFGEWIFIVNFLFYLKHSKQHIKPSDSKV